MADKENKRKCFKCGCSPAEDNVKLFRFPKPALRNLVRCQLWAEYIFPEKECSSIDLQTKLHSEHRMLCQKHFKDSAFTDGTKQWLQRTAVPCDDVDVNTLTCVPEPQPGPSHRVSLGEINTQISVTQSKNPRVRTKQTLPRTAISCDDVDVNTLSCVAEPQPGPSHRVSVGEINTPEINQSQKPRATTERERILFAKCRKYLKSVCQLQNRIKHLKAKNVLNRLSKDVSVKKLSEKLTPTFALLLQGQLRNCKKAKSSGWRWTRPEKITALRLFKRSPTCYRLMRRLFNLPSPTTLKTLLNKVPFGVGINLPVFEVLKKYVQTQKPSKNEYTLMFDEMSLKKHLNYNCKEDIIEGFQDHASQGRSPLIAAYALVFMITGIMLRVKQPIAHYFSSGFSTADRLAVLIKEVLQQCFKSGINIAAIVCDMDGVNRRALSILGASVERPYITFLNKEIVSFFDTPHLLKCFRNLFLKYNIECTTDLSSNDRSGRGIAKWSHIKDFHEADNKNKNFVFAQSLKKDHLNPNMKQKMKVKLAAQVLSHTVAAGMFARISAGELTSEALVTADMISKIDKLFDAMNSDCSDLRRGKPLATNIRKNSEHLEFYREMRYFFSTLKYVGSPRTPPSQEGWIWTLNAMERLWQNLVQKHNISSLATRRLQQDALENLFGCIRGNCGSNTNPTCGQFLAGLKTAVLSNLAHIGETGNCENDNNIVINNFERLLSSKCTESTHSASDSRYPISNEIPLYDEFSDSEKQACAYVCGFLAKKMSMSCDDCKNVIICNTVQQHHIFVEYKEYSESSKSLNYVTEHFVMCVESCASLANKFFDQNAHMLDVKAHLITILKQSGNFDFMNGCQMHKAQNIESIVNNVSYICLKRFCSLKNRALSEEASAIALKRKINIITHK